MRIFVLLTTSITITLVLAVASARIFGISFYEAAAVIALLDGAAQRILRAYGDRL